MDSQSRQTLPKDPTPEALRLVLHMKDRGAWRDKMALFLLGITTKFGYVVMFSAAQDLLHSTLPELGMANPPRHCFVLSTGVLLLATTLPAFLIQLILLALPKWYDLLATCSFMLSLTSFFILAWLNTIYTVLSGIVLTSLAYGVGEWILGTYSLFYKIKVHTYWKAAMNCVGVVASLTYAAVREFQISLSNTFFAMFSLPLIGLFCYWFLLRSPLVPVVDSSPEDSEYPLSIFSLEPPLLHFEDKCAYFAHMLKYLFPLGVEIVFQCFINHGLYEFLYFRGNYLSIDSQYRWYFFIYNVAVYACLVTKNLLNTDQVWIYTIFQFVKAFLYLCDAALNFIPFLWTIMLLTYFEGIISGAVYVNIMHQLYSEEPSSRWGVAENLIKQCIWLSTMLGGAFGILAHYFLCRSPEPQRP